MRLVGTASGVKLYAPSDAYFSYSNSPYIGHRQRTSIDIYPSHEKWHGPAYSPVNGEVIKLRRFRMGREREFYTESHDSAIGIQPDGSEEDLVRILHCDPTVRVGDQVNRGDVLGELLRSRYFNYWTGPHFHVEVMRMKDFARPSRSYQLVIPQHSWKMVERVSDCEIRLEVVHVNNDALLAVSRDLPYCTSGDLFGHCIKLDTGPMGVIDAGVPHYKKGIILSESDSPAASATLWNVEIGRIDQSRGHVKSISVSDMITIYLDKLEVRGISFYILTDSQLKQGLVPVKIIPQQYGALRNAYSPGDSCTLFLT